MLDEMRWAQQIRRWKFCKISEVDALKSLLSKNSDDMSKYAVFYNTKITFLFFFNLGGRGRLGVWKKNLFEQGELVIGSKWKKTILELRVDQGRSEDAKGE